MKVANDTPHLLVIVHRPWRLAAVLWLAAALATYFLVRDFETLSTDDKIGHFLAAAVAIACAYAFCQWITVRFDRSHGHVSWERKAPFYSRHARIPLSEVQEARVVGNSHGEGTAYRVVLVMRDSVRPLAPFFSGVDDWTGLADKINRWLKAGSASPV